jgi:predicted ABC-type exoprotein transport system permease subunit
MKLKELKLVVKIIIAFLLTVAASLAVIFIISPLVPNPNVPIPNPSVLAFFWLALLLEIVVFIGWWRCKQ